MLFVAGLVALTGLVALPGDLPAQPTSVTVGVTLGATVSNQSWQPSVRTSTRDGVLGGAYAEVALPGGKVSVRAGAEYVQRGAFVHEDRSGLPVDGEIRAEYVSFPIHAKITKTLGPVRVYVSGGPTVDQSFRTRTDPVLAQALDQESATVVSLAVGGGIGLLISDRFQPEVEVRWTEGLSQAFAGSFTTVRNRSLEILFRVGMLKTPN